MYVKMFTKDDEEYSLIKKILRLKATNYYTFLTYPLVTMIIF